MVRMTAATKIFKTKSNKKARTRARMTATVRKKMRKRNLN